MGDGEAYTFQSQQPLRKLRGFSYACGAQLLILNAETIRRELTSRGNTP